MLELLLSYFWIVLFYVNQFFFFFFLGGGGGYAMALFMLAHIKPIRSKDYTRPSHPRRVPEKTWGDSRWAFALLGLSQTPLRHPRLPIHLFPLSIHAPPLGHSGSAGSSLPSCAQFSVALAMLLPSLHRMCPTHRHLCNFMLTDCTSVLSDCMYNFCLRFGLAKKNQSI